MAIEVVINHVITTVGPWCGRNRSLAEISHLTAYPVQKLTGEDVELIGTEHCSKLVRFPL